MATFKFSPSLSFSLSLTHTHTDRCTSHACTFSTGISCDEVVASCPWFLSHPTSPPQASLASSTSTSVGTGVTFSLPDDSPQWPSQGGMAGKLDAIIESQRLESPPAEDQRQALHQQSSVYDSATTYKLFQKATQVG